ncbi:MAG: dihydroorotate dehydrogenase electron transfer subunit [Muribaculaceae bacterium]|nr:dihydroorotate dehydrogenase electron transfer subunit [Muribaculaceae bacterium]
MAKVHQNFTITQKCELSAGYCLLHLKPASGKLPEGILPGQFVEILAPDNATMLRRPISIHFVDYNTDRISLLIRRVGNGTNAICDLPEGEALDIVLPLGNGFSEDFEAGATVILVGGGVGVAPLLYQASKLKDKGIRVKMVYGARTVDELVVAEAFKPYCELEITTDDASAGTPGRVTDSVCFREYLKEAAMVQCCGPGPMMKAVAAACKAHGVACEVSLENMMACGLGACLCCVEKTVKGNVCVCTEGPVFNIEKLTW